MNAPNVDPTNAPPTATCGVQNTLAQVDCDRGAGPQSESWYMFYLRGFAGFVWTVSRGPLEQVLLSCLEDIQRWVVAHFWRLPGEQGRPTRLLVANDSETPPSRDSIQGQPSPAQTTSPRRVSWSYLRGVSLALSELCQDVNYGGDRIPLSAILDLMRQHQSAFVPLGLHVERDVPRRLIQLANEGVVFFDPFKEYVVVPEATRQRYALRRRELLAKGVDPANLSVFGAAFTRGLSPSERVTSAVVASYKGRFLLAQGRNGNNSGGAAALTRKESLISIADAICPARLMLPDSETEVQLPEDNGARVDAIRRGYSIVTDVARIVNSCPPDSSSQAGTSHGNELRRGLSILPEMIAIVSERDALQAQKGRLRTILETSD